MANHGRERPASIALHYQTPPRAIADDLGFHRKLVQREEEVDLCADKATGDHYYSTTSSIILLILGPNPPRVSAALVTNKRLQGMIKPQASCH